jgi:DNA-damage-inducible protein J
MMAANETTIRSRIDPAIKSKAEKVLGSMGLSMSEAVRLFLHQVVIRRALPFAVVAPNAKTVAAMKAADRGEAEPTTIEEIKANWRRHEKHRPNR